MRARLSVVASLIAAGLVALVAEPKSASAFCRTTTSPLPADFQPSPTACWTQGLPLYWKNACVSYDIQQGASKQVSYDTAASTIATAFSKWTGTVCPTNGTGNSRVSIDVRDLGPVACDEVRYNSDGPNQHVIVFRDDSWPHNDPNNTLALTTVTFDPDTGEIYDADMEINTAQIMLSLTDPIPANGYDFASIVTHETGHFLGMAHSGDDNATMYAHYEPGATSMRNLTSDDVSGICEIYPPNGTRSVDPSVAASGSVPEDSCDPTPRHGFTTQCQAPAQTTTGCNMAAGGEVGSVAAAGFVLAAALLRRRRAVGRN